MNNNIRPQNNASFLRSIRNTILLAGLTLTFGSLQSCKKEDTTVAATPSAPAAPGSFIKHNTIHYTLSNFAGSLTADEHLDANSTCTSGTQNAIAFANAAHTFQVRITSSHAFAPNVSYYLAGEAYNTRDAYSLATYKTLDGIDGGATYIPFQEGQSIITDYRPLENSIKISFSYKLYDPNFPGIPVTLEGYAIFYNITSTDKLSLADR